MGNISDKAFERFMAGDIAPFYRHLYPDMLLYARSVLSAEMSFLAEDCVQSAVEKTYHARSRFTSAAQWKGFMMTCIRNQAVSMVRHGIAAEKYADYFSLTAEESEDILLDYIRQETMSRLYAAIDALPADLRQILEMSFVDGLRNGEIAERLGVAEITVKKRKARVIAFLRMRVGPDALLLLALLPSFVLQERGEVGGHHEKVSVLSHGLGVDHDGMEDA